MLKGKQKRFLRSRAMTTRPLIQIGKNGLTDTFIDQLGDILERRELVKISLLQAAEVTTEEVAEYISKHLRRSEVVQIIGRMVVVYCPSTKESHQHISVQVNRLG